MSKITIPAGSIKGMSYLCATNDIRYYLNGLWIDNGYINATNGHYAGRLYVGGDTLGCDGLFLKLDQIKMILKAFTPKQIKNCDIVFEYSDDSKFINVETPEGNIQFPRMTELKYPDLERIIPDKDLEEKAFGYFNWEYMNKFVQAEKHIKGTNNGYSSVYLKTHGDGMGALVTIYGLDEFVGVIIPMRMGK